VAAGAASGLAAIDAGVSVQCAVCDDEEVVQTVRDLTLTDEGGVAEDDQRRPVSRYRQRPEEREPGTPRGVTRGDVDVASPSKPPGSAGKPTPRRLCVPPAAVAGFAVGRNHYAGRICSAPGCGERVGTWVVSVGDGTNVRRGCAFLLYDM